MLAEKIKDDLTKFLKAGDKPKISLTRLLLAAVKDKALAQPIDIQKFIDESGAGVQKMQIYGRRFGHKVDYDHINMLTHPQARQEQFMDVLNWFEATRAD